jgi:hypothetical protein
MQAAAAARHSLPGPRRCARRSRQPPLPPPPLRLRPPPPKVRGLYQGLTPPLLGGAAETGVNYLVGGAATKHRRQRASRRGHMSRAALRMTGAGASAGWLLTPGRASCAPCSGIMGPFWKASHASNELSEPLIPPPQPIQQTARVMVCLRGPSPAITLLSPPPPRPPPQPRCTLACCRTSAAPAPARRRCPPSPPPAPARASH